MPNFGVIEKTAPVEKDSPLLPLMDQWIEHEKTLDTSAGNKAYLEDTFPTVRDANRFRTDLQLAARQRDRGTRTTRFEVLDEKGKAVPEKDGKYDEAKVASVIVGCTLGARKRRNGALKAEQTEAAAE